MKEGAKDFRDVTFDCGMQFPTRQLWVTCFESGFLTHREFQTRTSPSFKQHISCFYRKALLFWKGSRHMYRRSSTPSILTHLPTLKRVLHSRECLLGSYFGAVSLLKQWSLPFYCTFDQISILLQCTFLAAWENLEHRMLLICLYFPRVPFSTGQSV